MWRKHFILPRNSKQYLNFFLLATEYMLPEWVMIRKLLELYYHRWQLWGDRQVMLRGKDKRLWHYVWRVKDSQSKLELLLLDQYFSVQHLSWLLVRGFCRYEHWESKIKVKKMIVAVHLHVDCWSYLGFRSTIPFFVGQPLMTWKQDKTYKFWITVRFFPCPFPSFCAKKAQFSLNSLLCSSVPFYTLQTIRSSGVMNPLHV